MRTTAIFLSALILAGTAFTAAEADARVRQRHATVNTERGQYTANSRVERQRGERTRERTVTGPNGRQSSVYDQRRWDTQQGTYSHDRTRVYANGQTRTVDADAQRVEPGVWSYERDVTRRNGETRSRSGEITIEPNP